MGAGTVLVTARHPHQAEMALSLGADEALPSEADDLAERVEAATDGRGADLTLESVGGYSGATFDQAIRLTRTQGRIVLLGRVHGAGHRRPDPAAGEGSSRSSSRRATACWTASTTTRSPSTCSPQAGWSLDAMVTHRFPLGANRGGLRDGLRQDQRLREGPDSAAGGLSRRGARAHHGQGPSRRPASQLRRERWRCRGRWASLRNSAAASSAVPK